MREPTKVLWDGRVVDESGTIWNVLELHGDAMKVIGFDVCMRCQAPVLVVETPLGGHLKCDDKPSTHRCGFANRARVD